MSANAPFKKGQKIIPLKVPLKPVVIAAGDQEITFKRKLTIKYIWFWVLRGKWLLETDEIKGIFLAEEFKSLK